MADSISENVSILDQHAEDVVTRLMAEGPIGMNQAAKACGSFRDGKPTHPTTVVRWAQKGVKLSGGRVLKLESFRLNGRLATSRQALVRFVQAQQSPPSNLPSIQPTPAQRNRAAQKASDELDAILGEGKKPTKAKV